jgi:hypothetical protein
MINIGGNPLMILLAIIAALGGIGLYFVRSFRPELARDHDIFFSAIALVYGIILLSFNFRMEITTQLAQVLVVGFAGWFAVEALILRQALSTQARRSPMNPIEDDPIDPDNYRGYRAEIDPNREFSARRTKNTRQMQGTKPTNQSELRGDVERKPRRTRNEAVIDIDEDDIRPVSPKQRRPRPSSDSSSQDQPPSRGDRTPDSRNDSRSDFRNESRSEPRRESRPESLRETELNSDRPRRKRPRNSDNSPSYESPNYDGDINEQDW